jgi:acyl-CoA synthetase (AMP-forming)/AMP-acid ligase II
MPDTPRPSDPEVSRIFRSTFPRQEFEDSGFRTGSWRVLPRSAEELKPLHPTLLHAFAAAARLEEKAGITLLPEDEDDKVLHQSYRELYERSKLVSAALEAAGVRRGDRIVLVLPTSFEFVICFFACQRLQAVPCPSYPPAALEKAEVALERIAHITAHAQAAFIITNRSLQPLLGGIAHRVRGMRDILVAESLLRHRAREAKSARAHATDAAFVQYTSGSTGSPKGVMLSHHNLVANLHAIGQGLRVRRTDIGMSWLPTYHDMGLIGGLLFFIYWRLPLVLMPPTAFLMRPVRWLKAIQDYRATVTAAPNFAYGLCVKRVRARDREGLDLSSLRLTLNGAEPVNLKTLNEFHQSFAPHGFKPEAMFPVYGLAEATLAVTFPPPGEPLRALSVDRQSLADGRVVPALGEGAAHLVCVGRPVPGHDVQVVDERGRTVVERQVGHVLVRGPGVMQGYFGGAGFAGDGRRPEGRSMIDPKATQAVLRGGWLWTGDLGFIGDGGLYIAGRAKDLIIVRGKNHYAEDVERVAEKAEGVRPGGAVAFAVYDEEQARDLVVIVCETRLDDESQRETLVGKVSELVSAECSLPVDEVVLVPPGTIPKTSSGKRQRALCRKRYLDDTLLPEQTSALKLALVFARSGAGFLRMLNRRFLRGQREPDEG